MRSRVLCVGCLLHFCSLCIYQTCQTFVHACYVWAPCCTSAACTFTRHGIHSLSVMCELLVAPSTACTVTGHVSHLFKRCLLWAACATLLAKQKQLGLLFRVDFCLMHVLYPLLNRKSISCENHHGVATELQSVLVAANSSSLPYTICFVGCPETLAEVNRQALTVDLGRGFWANTKANRVQKATLGFKDECAMRG